MGTVTSLADAAIKSDPGSGPRAVIYVRISRDKRKGSLNEGIGVKEQEHKCRELAERCGYRVVKVFVDNDKSAYSGKPRPDYMNMLTWIKRGMADVVLCWHTDRLHRDNTELEDYIKIVEPRDVRTETVHAGILDLNTAGGRANARFLCTVARLEVELRSERVKLARERQARNGEFGGGTRPYGFEDDGENVRESEAEVIRQAAGAFLSGVKVKGIARDMRKLGLKTAQGAEWTAEKVRDMLLRPRNAGLSVHRSGVRGRQYYTPADVVGTLPGDPIIQPDEYWTIVRKLTDPDRRTNHAGTAPKWLGSGIYKCPCGETLRVGTKTYQRTDRRTGIKTHSRRKVYRCQSGHVTVPREDLDILTVEIIKERIRTSDPAEIIGTRDETIDVAALRAQLDEHHERLDEIAADYEDDNCTKSQYLTRTEKRRKKIADVEAKLAQANEQYTPAAKLIGVANIDAAWDDLTLGEQREIVSRLLVVTVRPVGRGTRADVRDRVNYRRRPLPAIAA